ncbi:MAG: PAS domain S-box protein [Thermodesulfovibrionales bacterium]
MKTPEDITKGQLIMALTELRTRIDELQQSEEDKMKQWDELSRTKAMFEGLFEFSPTALIVVNRHGNIDRTNKQAEKLFGYSGNELINLHHEVLLPEEFRGKHVEHRRKYMSESRIRPMGTGLELVGRRKDGSEFPVDISLGPLKVEEEMVVLAAINDVSERKKAEEALRQSEQRFSSFMLHLPAAAWIKDLQGRYIYANEEAEQIFSTPVHALIGKTDFEIFPTETAHQFVRNDQRALAEGGSIETTEVLRQADGIAHYSIVSKFAVPGADGKPMCVAGVAFDITERKLAEVALRQSEEKYKFLVDATHTGYVILDGSGRVIDANQEYVRMTGHEALDEILGRSVVEWTAEYDLERNAEEVKKCAETGHVRSLLIDYVSKNGRITPVEINADAMHIDDTVRIYTLCRDISEQRHLEEERLRTQKLESIGTLAGGIAHDFNNLLQGLFGYISLARVTLEQPQKAGAMLQQAEEALHLTVNLTNQLLTFSKGGTPVKRLIRLEPVIENAIKFALSGSHTNSKIDVAADLLPVEADEGQLAQVIQNIVLNASESMAGRGTVIVSIRNTDIPKETISGLPEGGRFVSLSIQDSGTGISGENLAKIFDPYFTTKQKGSGLGLATSYSIIRNHGGIIDVQSEPGKGSTFTIYLPASKDAAVADKATAPMTTAAGKRKILVMDDEELVRKVVKDMIESLGHEVECAAAGEAAIKMFRHARESGIPFDVVILDLTVKGGMGGEIAVRKLAEIDPYVFAIASSGYADNPVMAHFQAYGFSAFLNKPYKIGALRDCINKSIKQI